MKRHDNKTIMVNRDNIKVKKRKKEKTLTEIKREKVTFKEIT